MDEKTVAVYDIDRAAKLCTYSMNWGVKQLSQANFRDAGPTSSGASPSLSFSPDGHRLIICAGVGAFRYIQHQQNQVEWRCAIMSGNYGQTAVLNADTGEVLPALQDGECLETQAGSFTFSGNGRLLVLSGRQYIVAKELKTADGERIVLSSPHSFLKVWDTQTGKLLKSWNHDPLAAFNPARPLLAVLEANGDDTRIGFWDFSAETADKK
jgi:WD40 repeat protein